MFFPPKKIIHHSMCVCFMYMFAIQLFDCKNIIWNVENYKIDTQRLRVAWCSWKSGIMEWGATFRIRYQYFCYNKSSQLSNCECQLGGTWIKSKKKKKCYCNLLNFNQILLYFFGTHLSHSTPTQNPINHHLLVRLKQLNWNKYERWMIEIV